jgi:hypothetical protein
VEEDLEKQEGKSRGRRRSKPGNERGRKKKQAALGRRWPHEKRANRHVVLLDNQASKQDPGGSSASHLFGGSEPE